VSIVANHAEITFKRFAGHSDDSISKTFEGVKGDSSETIIGISAQNRERREASTDTRLHK
jgi:hypothetical protein